jgi:hypothetical protein
MTYPSPRSLGGGAAAYHERAGRVPNPQGPPPPLPNGIPFRARDYRAGLATDSADGPTAPSRVLRGGCYLARYTPLQVSPTQPGAIYYLGTLRVQQVDVSVTISGDLYLRRVASSLQSATPEPDPGNGIPIFPRGDYRYYLRATQVSADPQSNQRFKLGLEMFRFNHATATWANEGALNADLSWTTSPPGYPSDADYLTGELKSEAGAVTGTLTLGWVSSYLRRATFEIDSVADGVIPSDNGNGIGFKDVFDPLGWDLRVIVSDPNVPQASGPSWSDAEMHEAMLKWRDRRDMLLDVDWRYHLLCVNLIDETERGIMYDHTATDANRTPREGIGIACDWVYPNSAEWGELQGRRFGDDKPTYFRTAIHEFGHALGLYHNASDNGFMNTTDVIARRANPQRPFPQNIRWAFNPDDEKRLRHMPDLWVRPGGIQFGEDYSVAPIAADDAIAAPDGLRLAVTAVSDVLPLGAPARIDFTMTNESAMPVRAPENLSMRGGAVRGKVIDPSGTVRTFQPLVQCVESQPLAPLAPGQSISHSATLLRGPQGALFSAAGLYRIVLEVSWDDMTSRYGLLATTDLVVTAAVDMTHGQAIHDVLANPDTLVAVAASAPAGEGAAAIRQASKDAVLGPHYVWLDAKQACRSTDPNKARDALLALDCSNVVLSSTERKKAKQWLDQLTSSGQVSTKPPASRARDTGRRAARTKSAEAPAAPAVLDLTALVAKVRQKL